MYYYLKISNIITKHKEIRWVVCLFFFLAQSTQKEKDMLRHTRLPCCVSYITFSMKYGNGICLELSKINSFLNFIARH